MNYLILYFGSIAPYHLLAILIILFFARQKDRDIYPGVIFDGQNWNLYDVLICVFAVEISYIIIGFLDIIQVFRQSYFIRLVLFWVLIWSSFYLVFNLKLKQNFSSLGFSKKGFWGNIFYGLKIMAFINLFSYGLFSLLPEPTKWVKLAREAYNDWFIYQDNLYVVVSLVVIFVFIGPVMEELINRGFMYSPFRKKVAKWEAIFLTTIVFSLYYYRQLFCVTQVVWTYVYEKRRSLVASIAAHVFYSMLHVGDFIYITDYIRLGYSVDASGYSKIMFLICLLLFIISWFVGNRIEAAEKYK